MQSVLFSFLAGVSTVLGVFVLLLFGRPSKRVLAGLLGFAGGIMIAISLFELIPESVDFAGVPGAALGFVLGVALMFTVDRTAPHAHVYSPESLEVENPAHAPASRNPLMRTGYLVLFGIALHNLPEGVAIGAGLESSPKLGLAVAVAIALHNIPEGLAIGGPLRSGGLGIGRIILLTLAAGLMTPVGAIIGQLFFNISEAFVGGALAFAAGAMIYIVLDELVPNANKLHPHWANIGINFAILLGFILFLL